MLDADGRTLVTLEPGGKVKRSKTRSAELTDPPAVSDAELAELDESPDPPPAGFTPVSRQNLLRRWVPEGHTGAPAFVQLLKDGEFGGSDGCNGVSGRWTLGSGGHFLAVSNGSTLVGCHGVQVDFWLTEAAYAALDHDTLVFVGPDGKETGRLTPG